MEELTTKVINITPELAKEYLACNRMNRPVVQAAVDKYANLMLRGEWKLNGEAICFAAGGALINGQHRLLAIIKANIPIQMLVVYGVEDNSFFTYDQGRNRSAADIFALSEVPNAAGISSSIQKYFRLKIGHVIAVGESRRGYRKEAATKVQLLEEYKTDKKLWQNVFPQARSWANKAAILRAPEATAIIVYLFKDKKHPQSKIIRFFEQLFEGKGITNDTILILRNKYIADKMGKSTMTPLHKQQLLIKAWNAYITDKDLKRLYWDGKEVATFI